MYHRAPSSPIPIPMPMPFKPPGVLGITHHDFTRPSLGGHPRAVRPGLQGLHIRSSVAELEHKAAQLAHRVSIEIGWHATRSAAYNFLGSHSFTAGVVVGLGENLCQSVVMLVDLLKTLALAEYWECRNGSTWQQFRSRLEMSVVPGLGSVLSTMSFAGRFIPHLDDKARAAYDERQALFEAVRHAFSNPEEVLGKLTASQVAKAKAFAAHLDEKTPSGNYEAGKLFGELLLDLLLVIDVVAGIAKLAAKVPRLLQYTKKLASLAKEMRLHRELKNVADANKFAEPPPKSTTIRPIRSSGYGGGAGASRAVDLGNADNAAGQLRRTTALLTDADPARAVLGPGVLSHPEEIAAMRQSLEEAGVEVIDRSGAMAYSPGLQEGVPGQMLIDPDASYSAWLHEYQHAIDDQAIGWGGMKTLFDPDIRWQWEQNAYGQEINLMQSLGRDDVAKQLGANMEVERRNIFGN
jgi:hypothetical protein